MKFEGVDTELKDLSHGTCSYDPETDTIAICVNHLCHDPILSLVHELSERDNTLLIEKELGLKWIPNAINFDHKIGEEFVSHLLSPYGDNDLPGDCANFNIDNYNYKDVDKVRKLQYDDYMAAVTILGILTIIIVGLIFGW